MCLVLRMHTCHLLSTHQSPWLEETGSMVTARAFAWTHFPCLSSSLSIVGFSVHPHPVCFWLLLHGLIPTVSQLLCSFPCCGVKDLGGVLWDGQP